MAANFWKSSHWQQWILERSDLLRDRGHDLKTFSEDEYQKVMMFYCNAIQAVGNDHRLRQQIIATAIVYFKRFYLRRTFKDIDPTLMIGTTIFTAAKVEEFAVMSSTNLAKSINSYFRRLNAPDLIVRPHLIFDAEFMLLEILDCSLYVWHPYRPLKDLLKDMREQHVRNADEIHNDAWMLCNDMLRTDASLLYPPYIIAIACTMIAAMVKHTENDLYNWLVNLHVDFEQVFDCQRLLFNLTRLQKSFDDKEVYNELILPRMPKPGIHFKVPAMGGKHKIKEEQY